ncbi:hypothetical protein SAMN05519103_03501 [Rhizobiales bacterium GAS113]|nr:hypothetical protein SAMN05519103_03501 [Rhizobiales bacterium GAS113]SEE60963.1 hypothetical protein SAMN05519104_6722 [Rhizobiales bacterium GAS188]
MSFRHSALAQPAPTCFWSMMTVMEKRLLETSAGLVLDFHGSLIPAPQVQAVSIASTIDAARVIAEAIIRFCGLRTDR